MALFETHGEANKKYDELSRTIETTWSYTDSSLQPHTVRRIDFVERYRYIFMTKEAAEVCQEDMISVLRPALPVPGVDVNVDVRAYPTHNGVAWEVSVAYHRISHVEVS